MTFKLDSHLGMEGVEYNTIKEKKWGIKHTRRKHHIKGLQQFIANFSTIQNI